VNCGILGGTFNPIHCAHLRLAEVAREALGLARIAFIPASQPPLKHRDVAPASDRLAMVERAIANNPAFEVLRLELERQGPSYSVDTLRELRRSRGAERFWFILGSDALRELHLWHEPAAFLELTSIAVAARPGSEAPLEELLPESLRGQFRRGEQGLVHDSGQEIRQIPFAPLEVSASEIRRLHSRNRSIRYLVPDPVLDYIEKRGLYTEIV